MTEEIKKPEGENENAVEFDLDAEAESLMDQLSTDEVCEGENEPCTKEKKKETKQLRDENKQLTAKLAEATGALEKAQTEAAEANDKYLRICAEYENFRKRSQKEREGIYTDAYADALKEILPVIDNLERAAQYSEADKLAEGISLIFKSASEMLTKLGIESFGEAGETFDPNIHNAVMHIEDEEHGENEIIDVFQKGYKKGDKIIRFAMVRVAN